MIERYQKRTSGPLLDRIDIHVEVPRVDYEKLTGSALGESSASVRARVEAARERQRVRFEGTTLHSNADMGPAEVRRFCELHSAGRGLIKAAMRQLGLSARGGRGRLCLARRIPDEETLKQEVESLEMERNSQRRTVDWRFTSEDAHDLVDFPTLRGIVASSNILPNTLHWMAAKRHEETEEDGTMTHEAKRELIEQLRSRYVKTRRLRRIFDKKEKSAILDTVVYATGHHLP